MSHEESSLSRAASFLRSAREVVVFTGAGVSAESGIPTFRDDDGFWQNFPVNDFATWKGLVRTAIYKPRRVAEFIHALIRPIAEAKPNAAHRAVADMERHVGVTVVTQNIDNLHQEAGSTIVHEVHGSLFEVTRRGRFHQLLSRPQLIGMADRLDRARRGWFVLPRTLWAVRPMAGLGPRGLHVPKLVLFGDAMAEPAWSNGLAATQACDCMIQVGTSGNVWPAAMLPQEAQSVGAKVITIDPNCGGGDVLAAGNGSNDAATVDRGAV